MLVKRVPERPAARQPASHNEPGLIPGLADRDRWHESLVSRAPPANPRAYQPSHTGNDGFSDKQWRILDAASEEFFEKGYTGARLDRIAARLGVTKPFIYYHFKNKADLLAAVCGRTTAFAAVLAEDLARRRQAPALSLASLVVDLTVRIIAERKYLTVYFRDGRYLPPAVQASLLGERQRFHLALSELLREGVRTGEFRIANVAVAGQTLTGMMMWVFNWYNPQGKATPQQVGEMMAGLALNAVGAQPGVPMADVHPGRPPASTA